MPRRLRAPAVGLLLAFVFLPGLAGSEPAAVPADAFREASGFSLKDQHGREHTLAFPRKRITVLLMADKKGSRQIESWIRPLSERFGEDIHLAGVARLKGVPPFLREMVSRLFREKIDYPVMLDWSGGVSRDFAYRSGTVNVFVIEQDGDILLRLSGEATEDRLTLCYRRIDELLEPNQPSETR